MIDMKQILFTLSMLVFFIANSTAQTAKLQVIHNCADALADTVDVYANGNILLDNVAFRTASSFLTVPAKTPVRIGVAPGNSASEMDTVYSVTVTLDSGKTYIAVANGIINSMGYSPAPAFGLNLYNMGRESAANNMNTDVLVVHGSTDAFAVDVSAGSNVLVDNLEYGNFSNNYLELATQDYTLTLTDSMGGNKVADYTAPLQTLNLQGAAIVVVASGFVNTANNSNGPAFGLYAATANGGALVQLPVATNISSVIANDLKFSVYPIPADNQVFITGDVKGKVLEIIDMSGAVVKSISNLSTQSIDVSGLVSGNYIIRVTGKDAIGTQGFVKY